jgi:hypothetical protein
VPKLAALIIAAVSVAAPVASAQESVSIGFTTSVTGDDAAAPDYYAPFNLWAVWVEDSAGNFVRTIGRNDSAAYMQHVVAWTAASGGRNADTDAVSGATRADHGNGLSITWDLTDRSGALVADGIYTIRMELADENTAAGGAPANNNQATFTVDKNGTSSTQGPLSDGGFNDVDIAYLAPDAALCGNGAIDPGETCDSAAAGGEACETSCADTGDACMPALLMGDAATCTAMCSVVSITECVSGDGCCATGCGDGEDTDCVGANVSGGCSAGGGAGGGLGALCLLMIAAATRRRRHRAP